MTTRDQPYVEELELYAVIERHGDVITITSILLKDDAQHRYIDITKQLAEHLAKIANLKD